MGRYLRKNVEVEESTHVRYGSIWGATVEIVDSETGRVVETIQVDARDGRAAANEAVSKAIEWIREHDQLEQEAKPKSKNNPPAPVEPDDKN
jgi:creatinine amidohydrolase/Fe(II)-dependent formamide hydrolase-like protein